MLLERNARPIVAMLLLACLAWPAAAQQPAAPDGGADTPASPAPPRLLVIVSIDQCRAEYLQRFLPLLPAGGIRRLLEQGASFPDAAHTHTVTSTGPGHAAIATGCLPARVGVPENEFIDAGRGRMYCVEDAQAQLVGSGTPLPQSHVSARGMERPTLGDLLKEHEGEGAQVCSVSWKDRAALLMGGARSDGSYWIEPTTGSFVTTSAIRAALPDWLCELNAQHDIAASAGSAWQLAIDPERALQFAGPDDAPGETSTAALGRTFPHVLPMPPREGQTLQALSERLALTPTADQIVQSAVRAALEHEPLGRDETTDLLCVGYSALDFAGHAFGPHSQEVLDVFLGVDRQIADLLALLDARVGAGRWTLALSADHGVADVPEQSGGLRTSEKELQDALEAALAARHGAPPARGQQPAHWIRAIIQPGVWLDRESLRAAGLPLAQTAAEVAADLAALPGIEHALTRAQLAALAATPEATTDVNPDLRALAADVHPTRSGDVLFLVTRNTVVTRDAATTHGTHHDYDRRVPLVLCGAGVRPGVYPGAAAPIDIMPTLARIAGLPAPEGLDGHALSDALLPAPQPLAPAHPR